MKQNRIREKTKKLTAAAILAALGVLFLLLGSLFETLDLSFAAASSFLVVLAVIELGRPYPLLLYGVVSLLSLLLLPAKFAAVCFALFFGFYPMAKAVFERYHVVAAWVLKCSLFNVCFFAILFVSKYLLGLPDTELFDALLLLMGNAAFVLFDIVLSKLITLYLFRLRKRLGMQDYFE